MRCNREEPRSRKTCRRKHLCDRPFPVCARRDDNFVAISNAALLIKSREKRCSAARKLLPVDRCARLAHRFASFVFVCSSLTDACLIAVQDTGASARASSSRKEDEVRGGAEEVAVDRIPAVQRDPHQQTVSSFGEQEVQGNRQKLSVTFR